MASPRHPPHLAQRRPALAWALVLAMLLAQGLGLWHRVQHGPAVGLAHSLRVLAAAPEVGAVAAVGQARAEGGAHHAGLFGHATGEDAQCQLYDHASSGLGLLAAAAAAAAPLPAAAPAVRVAPAPAPGAPARPYEARAPPRA